jgi:hypothetical protein
MEPETRNQYFENSLPNGSNLSLNKKSSKESLNGRDRADFHWSMLRTGWRDAVKADLQTSFDAWAAKRNHNAFWRLLIDNYRLDG